MEQAYYVKEPPKEKSQPINLNKYLPQRNEKRERAFFLLISFVGLAAIVYAIFPLVIWQVSTLPKLNAKIDEAPIPDKQVLSTFRANFEDINVERDEDGFSYFTTDFIPEGQRPDEFSLSIPKLRIENAQTKVDNLNFKKHLSHFPGTAIPGEVGNSFVTGHSILPQFNDPDNYNAIFTKLSDLELGDDVIVELEGKKLHFIVQYAKVVDPKNLSVLAPISQSGKNLTLMTCVPPGTNTKRLVVITSLI